MQAFGKARPRCRGKIQPYMPTEYKEKVMQLQAEAKNQENENNTVPAGAVAVTILITRAIPKSTSKKSAAAMNGAYCASGADVDNVAGAIMDALFPHTSGGDSRVVSLVVSKVWGVADNITVSIEAV